MRKHIPLQKLAVLLIYTLTLSLSLAFHAWAANRAEPPDSPVIIVDSSETVPALAEEMEAEPEAEPPKEEPEPEKEVLPAEVTLPETPAKPEDSGENDSQRTSRLAGRKETNRALKKETVKKLPGTVVEPKPADKPAEPVPPPPAVQEPAPEPAPAPQPEPNPEPLPEPQPEIPAPPSPPAQPPAPEPADHDTELNPYVLDVIRTYTNGPYPYLLLNGDYDRYNGVTENIWFGGRLLARAHPSGIKYSHCVGITFEVFFKAMQARNRKLGLSPENFNGMAFNEIHDFLLLWYAAGPKSSYNLAAAVEKYGIGRRITHFEDAKRGDFMDFSRTNGTGHAVVFLNWVYDRNGTITGFDYWSSQGSGIGEKREYFTSSGLGKVMTSPVYIARILPVKEYRRFR